MNETFNISELCDYLRCSESFIRQLVRNKSIKSFRIGNRLYFKKSSIDDWIETQELNSIRDTQDESKIKNMESEVSKNE